MTQKYPTRIDPINQSRKKLVSNYVETNTKKEKPTISTINYSDKRAEVPILEDQIPPQQLERIIAGHYPLLLTKFDTNLHLRANNLPKYHMKNYGSFNFAYGKDSSEAQKNYDKMIKAKKIVISVVAHEYEKNNNTYDIVRMFCLAPELENSELPIVYRIDMLSLKNDPDSFNIRCCAIVAGAVNGICCLNQLNSPTEKGANSIYYKMKSEHTTGKELNRKDDFSNRFYESKEIEGIKNRSDALKFASSSFNVESIFPNTGNKKFYEILSDIEQKKYHLTPFDANEVVKEFFETDGAITNSSDVPQVISKPLPQNNIVIKTESDKPKPKPGTLGE